MPRNLQAENDFQGVSTERDRRYRARARSFAARLKTRPAGPDGSLERDQQKSIPVLRPIAL
jgi:hypothetical protein